jgi:hypothetical protein
MKQLYAAFILAGSLTAAGPAALAQTTPPAPPAAKTAVPKATVTIGSATCFVIRECVAGQTPQQRADHILDVFNKYLGGSAASFAVKPAGKNVLITMNKDKLVVVTPQDAKTAKAKNPVQLAARWKTSLAKAFDETKATK